MKTISLTDSAYQRLSSWKEGCTFSEVVERMVPAKGTMASALAAAESMPNLSDKGFDALEPKNGSWLIALGAEVACLWGNGTRFNRLEHSPSG